MHACHVMGVKREILHSTRFVIWLIDVCVSSAITLLPTFLQLVPKSAKPSSMGVIFVLL